MSSAARRRRREADDWLASDQRGTGVQLLSSTRVLLALVSILAAGVTAYGLFIEPQLALTVAGLAVGGVALALLGFSLAAAAIALANQGSLGRAVLVSFLGGLCVLAASGCVGAALVLGILVTAG